MVLRLRAVAARVGYVEAPVVVGYALRLVAHVAGVDDELRAEVYLRHIAVVGVRRYVEEATVVGSQTAVVGYVLRGGNGGAVGAYVLYYVRPVYGDGYKCVVHLQDVVSRVAESLAGVLLLKPMIGEHAVVEQRDGGVVHAPQTLAEDEQAVVVGCRLTLRGRFVGWFERAGCEEHGAESAEE